MTGMMMILKSLMRCIMMGLGRTSTQNSSISTTPKNVYSKKMILKREIRVIERPNGCWEPIGKLTQEGYCQKNFKGYGRIGVHTAMLLDRVGPPQEEGMTPDHDCLNPTCCNPDHLEWVTRAEQEYRKIGIKSPKLDSMLVFLIDELLREGNLNQTQIAARTGVSRQRVNHIATGWSYSHLTGRVYQQKRKMQNYADL